MNNLNKITGSEKHKDRKRVGRGSSAGGGKTAGRGTKGQKARTGGSVPAYFEGGQTPWIMRLKKKKGFTPHNKMVPFVVNLGELAVLAPEGTLTVDSLMEAKRIEPSTKVKILAKGEVTRGYQITAHFISKAAQAKIEAAGGSITILS